MTSDDERVTMVIDCDAGVDDATAIMMALARPNVDLIAVTCVKGNTDLDNVTTNVLRVLRTCGRLDIPVFRGASKDLLGTTPTLTTRHGKDGLGDIAEREEQDPPSKSLLRSEHAVPALIRLAKERPQQITLVAIGPLTNVALAMRLDPEFTSNLKEMVVMGGNILGRGNLLPASEFNFWADPSAAHVVLGETQCPTMVVPLETCQNHSIQLEWFDGLRLMTSPRAKFLAALYAHLIKADANGDTTGDTTNDTNGGTTSDTTGDITGGTAGDTNGGTNVGATGDTNGTTGDTACDTNSVTADDTNSGTKGDTKGDTTGATSDTNCDTNGDTNGGTNGDTNGGTNGSTSDCNDEGLPSTESVCMLADGCAMVVAASRSSVRKSTLTTCRISLHDDLTRGQLVTAKISRPSCVPRFPGPEIEVIEQIDQSRFYDMLYKAAK